MATEIVLPALAPSMTEGTLSRWIKKLGDEVKIGDVIAEIETDKALVELEASHNGVLAEILVQDGATNVKVDSPIAILAHPGETAEPSRASAAAAPVPDKAPTPPAADSSARAFIEAITESLPGGAQRVLASPLARRLASEHDLDLSAVQGTGPNGRIVRADIDAALKVRTGHAAPSIPLSASAAAPLPAAAEAAQPARPAPMEAMPAGDYEEIPHSAMRRVIAQRLAEAKRDIPHFYLSVDCRVDALLALRKEINQVMPEDAKVSLNDFIVKAVAAALKKVPAANASWTESAVRRYRSVDISVAVATPGGLITPLVRNADQKSVGTISAEIKGLAERARQGRLQPIEYQGGGFTISNLGMYGIREFAAIINPPQACILAVGASEQRPVVTDGALAVATVMTCTLSSDHRVVDGSVGAEFLAAFKTLIERPHAILV